MAGKQMDESIKFMPVSKHGFSGNVEAGNQRQKGQKVRLAAEEISTGSRRLKN